jgi:Holliday junction resolvasome RuvABC endonuclease subunit
MPFLITEIFKMEVYMNKFIALDQSTTTTGYAIFEDLKLIESGVFWSKDKDILIRIEDMYLQLHGKMKEHELKQFIFEDTFKKLNINVSKHLAFLQGAIMGLAFVHDYAFNIYMPSAWRSLLGFKKKSKNNPQPEFKTNRDYQKHLAIEFANKMYGLSLGSDEDDRAEAICMGHAFMIDAKLI